MSYCRHTGKENKSSIQRTNDALKALVEYLSKSNNLQYLHIDESLSCDFQSGNKRQRVQLNYIHFIDDHLVFFHQLLKSLLLFVLSCSRVHGHVLQRALWQIRHAAAVRLLPILGPQLGVPEERHHGGNHQLWRWHHQPAGKWRAAPLEADIAFMCR